MQPSALDSLSYEDAALVNQVQQGDMHAFGGLIEKYQERVYNICLRMVGHPETARDLCQDTFVKALQAVQRFEQRSQFYTWLFRIAVNVCISHRRRAKNVKYVSIDESSPSGIDGVGGQANQLKAVMQDQTDLGDQQRLSTAEQRREVLAALETLEPEHRAVIVLRDIESFDYETIAEVLEIPVGTVRSRLHRARLALRDRLSPVMDKAG